MFESNMIANMQQMGVLKAIQGDFANPWRGLVSNEFEQWLDSITTKQETTEENAE